MSKHWDPRVVQGGRSSRYGGRPRRARSRWRRSAVEFAVTAVFTIGIVLFVAAGPAAWPFGLGSEPGSPRHAWVIDGDTIEYAGTRIRIADIDAPEMRGECAYETRLARRASARMSQLINQGPFEIQRTGTRDEDVYGRKLRIVTRGGRSLGDVLVAEGLARRWTGHREPWC